VYYGVAIVPFAIVFVLCRGYFSGWPPPDVMLAFVMSLVLAFLLGYFLEAMIGMLGFWFLEVSSLLFVYMLLNFFLSGQMFPLDMLQDLPAPWYALVKLIPLQYLAYFPTAVFLQKVTGPALWWGLAIQAGWVLFFIIACRVTFARGVRRYSGFGG
jgi:ABC-2 type transport system permease protein